MELGNLGCPDHILKGRINSTIGDVVPDGGTEEIDVLLHNAYIAPQRVQGEVPDILAINGNVPLSDIVETGEEMDNCTLATPWGAQDGGNLTGGSINRHLLQCWDAPVIREGDLLEADMTLRPSHLFGLRAFYDWRLRVQYLKQALNRGNRPRQ